MNELSIVVPCYNEEEVIEYFYKQCSEKLADLKDITINYLFVDDGSVDKTLFKLKELAKAHTDIDYISFSRNFGKEAAILAGLKDAGGEYVVVMDADLQHPPELLSQMIKYLQEGYDSVAARRIERKKESLNRRIFSKLFYRMSTLITDVHLLQGATDYRMMSRKMVDSVIAMTEYNRFSKGIFEWAGYETKWIEYEDVERAAGTTKWGFWGLFKYAIEGIVSFSTKPLKAASFIGSIISVISLIYGMWVLTKTMMFGIEVPGYASLIVLVSFIGGIQLIALGIIGEYLARTYIEVKKRPHFFVKDQSIKRKI